MDLNKLLVDREKPFNKKHQAQWMAGGDCQTHSFLCFILSLSVLIG
jgi:hypothetical protein